MVRGDVFTIALPRGRGRVQAGHRLAVIVQADELHLSTVLICPTSTSTRAWSIHPEVAIGDDRTRVMCEMVMPIDARTLGSFVDHLSVDDMRSVDLGLDFALDLG